MNKKIIAILLVFTLVITCFVACQKQKYETTEIGGKDVLLATDEEGNTIINDDNQFVAVVTDSEGEILTYADGEEQTYFIQISGSWVADGYIQHKDYTLAIPEGWRGTEDNKIIKRDTEDNCYISFIENKTLGENETIATYLEAMDQQNEQFIEALKQKGYTLTVDKKSTTIGTSGINYEWYAYKVVDTNGEVIHYAENYFFTAAKTIYSVNYICEEGIGYDETFDFGEYLKTGFTFKG